MKILIIKPSSFGDIVHGLQVAQALKEQLPNAEIAWVVRDLFEPLVSNCSLIDRVYVFHRNGGVSKFFKLIKAIREEKFDWVLDFQGLARSALLTLAARGKRKAIRSDAREFSGFGFWKRAPLPPGGENAHAVDILLNFLPLFDLEPVLKGTLSFVDLERDTHLPTTLIGQKIIVMCPNSRRPEKEWKGFADLTEMIFSNTDDTIVAWLGQQPIHYRAHWPQNRFFNLIGKTTILEMIELINRAHLVVSNDSGPMHLAAALNKTIIALFGPTAPERFGPYPISSPKNRIITSDDNNILKIGVTSVFETVMEYI